MVGFDGGTEEVKTLDTRTVQRINPNLTAHANTTGALSLAQNSGLSFIGAAMHGPFALDAANALEYLKSPNAKGCPNSDVVRPWANALTITKRETDLWIVDVPPHLTVEAAAFYEAPFKFLSEFVLPVRRKNRRAMRAKNWWILGDPQKAMRAALRGLERYFISPRVSKHRLFVWVPPELLATDATVAFASASDYIFGLVSSRFHEVWALAQGTQLREKESGFRYTPSTCVETFPFPQPTPEQEAAIAAAAKELNELRERWLNPPEWTVEKILDFPGSVDGPWARYVVKPDKNGIGTVRYPRLEPKDANCAKKLKDRTLTKLYNERPTWLDLAHKKLDAAVAAAYGWPADLTDEQILERLLKLNLERAAEEVKAGQTKKPKTSRAKQADELI
jgi:type II restriction/modification system DNA methylase subunit YeeA